MQQTRWVGTGLLGLLFLLASARPDSSPLYAQPEPLGAPKVQADTSNEPLPSDELLRRPLESPAAPAPAPVPALPEVLQQPYVEPPLGFTGPSGVLPALLRTTAISCPSRTAGGLASRHGTATGRATRCSVTIPTTRDTGGIPITRTSSKATTRSSARTRSWTLRPAPWQSWKSVRFPPPRRRSRARLGPANSSSSAGRTSSSIRSTSA